MRPLSREISFVAAQRRRAFSLVEVVVAVGIFAIAIIAIIGLMVPINQSVAGVRDGDDAVRVASIIQAELQRTGLNTVNGYIGQTIYASRSGDKIYPETSSGWDDDVPDLNGNSVADAFEKNAQKFFEVKLSANPTSTLNFVDAKDSFRALNIEIRWPGYTGDGNKVQGNAREQQSVLIVPAVINR